MERIARSGAAAVVQPMFRVSDVGSPNGSGSNGRPGPTGSAPCWTPGSPWPAPATARSRRSIRGRDAPRRLARTSKGSRERRSPPRRRSRCTRPGEARGAFPSPPGAPSGRGDRPISSGSTVRSPEAGFGQRRSPALESWVEGCPGYRRAGSGGRSAEEPADPTGGDGRPRPGAAVQELLGNDARGRVDLRLARRARPRAPPGGEGAGPVPAGVGRLPRGGLRVRPVVLARVRSAHERARR